MVWQHEFCDWLAAMSEWGYHPNDGGFTEPAALAALALLAHRDVAAAERPLNHLLTLQQQHGAIGISAAQPWPEWPTSLAVLAWNAAVLRDPESAASAAYRSAAQRGLGWLLTARGEPALQTDQMGHNTRLIGWSWVLQTHSWIEPTAFALLACRSGQLDQHPRVQEALVLLTDRLIASGGCNYGNTIVLGQQLRPHIQPTGIALLSLSHWSLDDVRIRRSIEFLERALSLKTPSQSLAWGLLGLAAHNIVPDQRDAWLAAAADRAVRRGAAAIDLATLLLADRGPAGTLLQLAPEVAAR